jgi:hypothetical protein
MVAKGTIKLDKTLAQTNLKNLVIRFLEGELITVTVKIFWVSQRITQVSSYSHNLEKRGERGKGKGKAVYPLPFNDSH